MPVQGMTTMQDLLKQVSRSFYLTLHVLPRSINAQIGLAYLLARAADTVADTRLVEVARRREVLIQIRESIHATSEGQTASLPDFGEFISADSETPAEGTLLENLGQLLGDLLKFPPHDRLRIGQVLETITRGQEMDLFRFGEATTDRPVALKLDSELDEYTYQVAGCVGEFWTHMCRAHVFPKTRLNDELLLSTGIRFGKGLQLVNILRDLPKDLRQGRCYLPEEQLSKHGLKPRDLLNAEIIDRFRPLYNGYLKRAEDHLLAGWQYTAMLPFGNVRIRLACAWPILIGVRTLEKLRQGNVLDDRHRMKLSRAEVRRLVFSSIALYPFRAAWNRQLSIKH
jgi:farnesyl-diphosphate farnesyltransferase